MDPTTAWEHPGFASSDPGGVALAAVKDDASLADLIRWDEVSGDTIVRAFGPGGKVKLQTSAGADFGIAWADVSKAGAVPADVGAAAVVHSHVWADVSKAGSSLADLAVRDASALDSGILLSARLAGAYTGITAVGTLTTLTVAGAVTLTDVTFGATVGAQKLRLFEADTSRYGFGIVGGEMRAFVGQDQMHTWGEINSVDGTTYIERMRLYRGILALGTTVTTGAAAGDLVLAITKSLRSVDGSGGTVPLISMDASNNVRLGYLAGLGAPGFSVLSGVAQNQTQLEMYCNWSSSAGVRRVYASTAPPAGSVYLYIIP